MNNIDTIRIAIFAKKISCWRRDIAICMTHVISGAFQHEIKITEFCSLFFHIFTFWCHYCFIFIDQNGIRWLLWYSKYIQGKNFSEIKLYFVSDTFILFYTSQQRRHICIHVTYNTTGGVYIINNLQNSGPIYGKCCLKSFD